MSKSWDDKNKQQQRKSTLKLAEQMGINSRDYNITGGSRNQSSKTFDDLQNDVANAFRNNYDVRRSMEAAKLSGQKSAEELGSGISGMDEAYDAYKFMKKTAVKDLGQTGRFSSANDYANVTNYLVNQDRDSMLDKTAETEASTETKASTNKLPAIDLRQDTAEAKQIVDNYNSGLLSGEGLSNNSIQRFAGIGSDNKAAGFLGDYSLKLRDGMKNVGMSTRGPASGSTTVQPEASSAPVPQANDTSDEFTERFKSGIKSNLVKS